MYKHIGSQSVKLEQPVSIISTACTVGPKEGQGPLAQYFDNIMEEALGGEDSWEKAESKMTQDTMKLAVQKAGLNMEDIDYILSGDLLNQGIGTTFGIRDFAVPFFGLYGACSTMGESMSLGAMLIDGGFAQYALVGASSHFCAAEKQFRFPLNLGSQRQLCASWTVTGQGSAILSKTGGAPYITSITTGKIIDMGITNQSNMGAAMAPAAVDTLLSHFKDTGRQPNYYDVIVSGDLGHIGKDIVIDMMKKEGYDLSSNYTDCGVEIFNKETQDTHAGGSGCACSAVTFAGFYYEQLKQGRIKNMLFIPTGALMSPTSVQQGESIPGIAHALSIETSF